MHFSKKSIPNPHFTPKSMHYFILSGEAPPSGKKKCILFLLQSPSGMHFSKKSILNPYFALKSMHLFYSAWQSPWFKKKDLVATAHACHVELPFATREFLTTTKAVEGTNNLPQLFLTLSSCVLLYASCFRLYASYCMCLALGCMLYALALHKYETNASGVSIKVVAPAACRVGMSRNPQVTDKQSSPAFFAV